MLKHININQDQTARWSLVVSETVDKKLRGFLGSQGAKKGSLSKYIEQAVLQRLRFEETIEKIQTRNEDFDENLILQDITDAVASVRAEKTCA